jgi:DNA-directed RNA polymerase subunit L
MKINILNRSKNELKIELEGEGHTFCNALQEMLLKDDAIEFTGYDISHPLIGKPIFYIRMKNRKKPEKALVDASKNLIKNLNELHQAFNKARKTIT